RELVCSEPDGRRWKLAGGPPACWWRTARASSSLSPSRGHGKHQWSSQINSGGLLSVLSKQSFH
ncbi:hypothetical protein XENOCAPTIV_013776, partial [Xenoophorus captivus]